MSYISEGERIGMIEASKARCERAEKLESHEGQPVKDLEGRTWLLLEVDINKGTVVLENWDEMRKVPATHIKLTE